MSGFRCPACSGVRTRVIESRRSGAFRIRRRRECKCGYRFTTTEILAEEYELINIDGGTVANLHRQARKMADTIDAIASARKIQNQKPKSR